ncbi:hypothetical protein R3W88_007152 [Solanum pinnatisectum]|uniref:Uncharacterized protein n=1 Tax=Solanum pinnatisectum TaxID=50273 RepID=A0AAV9KJ78_9SOLN|nr:hypothetical protein R3W88_007152 [Solanum pinnatisectum]
MNFTKVILAIFLIVNVLTNVDAVGEEKMSCSAKCFIHCASKGRANGDCYSDCMKECQGHGSAQEFKV